MGCGRSQWENLCVEDVDMIKRSIRSCDDKEFMTRLKAYTDYYANFQYLQLLQKMAEKIKQSSKQVEESVNKNSTKRRPSESTESLRYQESLHQSLSESYKNIFIITKTVDQTVETIQKELKNAKKQNRGIEEKWKINQDKILKDRKLKSEYMDGKQKVVPQRATQDAEEEEKNTHKSRSQQVYSASQKISTSQKNDLIDTQKQATERQMEKQRHRFYEKCKQHDKQVKYLREEMEKNNMNSNEMLAKVRQEHDDRIRDLNKQMSLKVQTIEDLNKKLEEKQNEIKRLLLIVQPHRTFTNLNSSQPIKICNDLASSEIESKFMNSKVLKQLGANRELTYRHKIDSIFDPLLIHSSKLLFSYDKVSHNNLNHYIHSQKNLLFVAKLENGIIVGGFSKEGFKQTKDDLANNHSFIFSLHQDDTCHKLDLKNEALAMHSVLLDKNYLRFGSNELRVTCEKEQLSCSVGTSSCIFENKKNRHMSMADFLGKNTENLKMKSYEVFELFLSSSQIKSQKSKESFPVFSQIPIECLSD